MNNSFSRGNAHRAKRNIGVNLLKSATGSRLITITIKGGSLHEMPELLKYKSEIANGDGVYVEVKGPATPDDRKTALDTLQEKLDFPVPVMDKDFNSCLSETSNAFRVYRVPWEYNASYVQGRLAAEGRQPFTFDNDDLYTSEVYGDDTIVLTLVRPAGMEVES
jgi:hypothetical protein